MTDTSKSVLSKSMLDTKRTNLDIAQLKEHMLHGIYAIENFLYAQAIHETESMVHSRELIKQLEDDLFNPANMQYLSARSKIELLKLQQDKLNNQLKFIQSLHGEVATGLETIKSLARETTAGAARDNSADENKNLKEFKNVLMQKIKEKTLKTKKEQQ